MWRPLWTVLPFNTKIKVFKAHLFERKNLQYHSSIKQKFGYRRKKAKGEKPHPALRIKKEPKEISGLC
jgi:hypothetical protein